VGHYIAWLKERVQIMHRILKPTAASSCTATGTPTPTSACMLD